MTEQIPGPPPKPLVGNMWDIDPANATHSMHLLMQQYGDIIQFKMPSNKPVIAVGSQRVVHEVSDTARFEKVIGSALKQVRNLAGNGETPVIISVEKETS